MTSSFFNISSLLGLRKQPTSDPDDSRFTADHAPSTSHSGTTPAATNKNKMLLVMGVSLLVIFGLLFGLRAVSSSMRKNRITPADPNLGKTVKTSSGKSSIVASYEEEINQKNLDGNAPADIKLIAKRFDYKPLGESRKTTLTNAQPHTTAPVEAVPVPVVHPTPAARSTTAGKKSKGRKQGELASKNEYVAVVEDPFNTVRVGGPQPTGAATSAGPAAAAKELGNVRYIPAMVYGKQTVRTRGKVRFRTTEAVTFEGVYIPRNTILTAIAFLGSGRIQFQVPSRMVAGQQLPVDLMCVDRDYQTGVAYHYDYTEEQMRQVGNNTVNDAVSDASTLLNYSSALGVAGAIGGTAVRGVANAITQGKRQKQLTQVEVQDGYPVFFKSTK